MKFEFKTALAEDVFRKKYAQGPEDTWPALARRVVEDVCGTRWGTTSMKFIPGGRYLYYAGREAKYFNNCFALQAEKDTREEWAALAQRSMSALMSGGGIGIDYSLLRPSGYRLRRTGGISSGPLPLMNAINELGRAAIQGGTRRSALWAGLNWQHEDIEEFIFSKDWSEAVLHCKGQDFDFPAPLDQTNISVLWDTDFAEDYRGLSEEGWELPSIWYDSVLQMCATGEPGHCYNFYDQEMETLRNACTEFISDRDSDVCNLGSLNLGAIRTIGELADVVDLASKFLVCGTLRADLPYERAQQVRNEYRKIGLGIMGFHEWLLQRDYQYSVPDELKEWLGVYRDQSEKSATEHAERFYIPTPRSFRAVAPAGTIGILASTTTGIEPLYSVASKRRYLRSGKWKYQYEVSTVADHIIRETGCDPNEIETARTLSRDVRRRIDVQADVQSFVDMGISSTINLPEWGSDYNNADTALSLAHTLAEYCDRIRGVTVYPDGARFGQPIEEVDYKFAKDQEGVIFDEREDNCKGGVCGI
jgi:ribonucleoside-diphosphate reductase alpha chain